MVPTELDPVQNSKRNHYGAVVNALSISSRPQARQAAANDCHESLA